MTNNEVLRSLRYALELDNPTLLDMLSRSGTELSARRLACLLMDEDEPSFEPLSDALLRRFLDGLIVKYRGPRESGPQNPPTPANAELTNNQILRALRIALELKDADILAIMERAGIALSKSELSALFRREDHRNYQPCGDQFLRNFIRGVASWHRQGRPRC